MYRKNRSVVTFRFFLRNILHNQYTNTMTKKNIIQAVKDGKLYWNDPDPIKGNDYKVTTIEVIDGETSFITYNNGHSEAEVYNSELNVRNIIYYIQQWSFRSRSL